MHILEIKDLEKLAKKRVPKMFFEYNNSGSWSEATYRSNIEDFKKIIFRQRVAVDITDRNFNIGVRNCLPSRPEFYRSVSALHE